MPQLAHILFASAVFCAAPTMAWAQPADAALCDSGAGLQQLPGAAALEEQLAQHHNNLPACQKNVAWLVFMGQGYNKLGRYSEAAEYLERALMLAPDDLSVQMQYALALAGTGDALASIYLLQDLQAQPALPAPLRAAVDREVARWSAPIAQAQWQHRLYLHTRLGHDSNLLGTPNLTSLTLTLPGQSLQLPLDPSYLRTAGAYTRVDAGWVATKGPWQWAASAGGRHSGSAPEAALQQLQASGEYSQQGRFASVTLGHLQSRSGTRYRTLGLVTGLQWNGDAALPVRARGSLLPEVPVDRQGQPGQPDQLGISMGANATPPALDLAGAVSAVSPLAPVPPVQPFATSFTPTTWSSLTRLGFVGSNHTCQTRLGPELQHRQIDSSPVLSGRYVGLVLQRTCQLQANYNGQGTGGSKTVAGTPAAGATALHPAMQAPTGHPQILQAWQISARWGVDTPTMGSATGAEDPSNMMDGGNLAAQRAGGRQQQASVRVAVLGRGLAFRHQWLLDAEVFVQTDATGYSPLLESGARRSLRRTALRAEYSLPLPVASHWQLALGAEWQRQSSNLALFRQQSHGAYVALRTQW